MDVKFDQVNYLKELEYLVNFDSGSRTPEGTAKVAAYFTEKFKQLGWIVQQHHISEDVGPCIEITNGDNSRYDVLLIGHMDTVFPRGTAEQRPMRIEGNKIYGPGANDMKASLLSAYYGLAELEQSGILAGKSICLLMNSDEELSSIYSRPLIEKIAQKSSYALVLEPARKNGEMVKQRRGVARYKLHGVGIAAHAGVNPQDGSSAINELAHWILALHGKNDWGKGTSVNVGIVSGGTGPNTIAPHSYGEVDVRFTDIQEIKGIETLMQQLEENPKTKGGAKITVSGGVTRPPMNPTEQALTLCDDITKLAGQIGLTFEWIATGGGSDASLTAACGVTTLDGFGPVGGGAHTDGEYLFLDTIEPRLRLLKMTIVHILQNLK